jgi:phosphatidylglycerol:prolipoprotein diacylglycerol transferase
VERFIVEFFRAKDDRFVGALTMAQAIALAVAAVGVALLVARGGQRAEPGRPATA